MIQPKCACTSVSSQQYHSCCRACRICHLLQSHCHCYHCFLCCPVCSFQLQALRPLTAGEEITISYGAIKPNAELLRDYGFFIPGNPCDRIKFSASSSSSSSSSSASSMSSADALEGLPGLNPVSLLEVSLLDSLLSNLLQKNLVAAAD